MASASLAATALHGPFDGSVDLLRFATAGSVDDGKSTLIGRLLYDAKAIFADQLEHVETTSRRRGDTYTNLALLTDGLRAEREQGITIDVAYRYFSTPRRRFIIADTPGHRQYTRNMVTGASTADLALVLVDARHGLTEQSRRHATIASLLELQHLVVCVNKMDLVGWDQRVFTDIVDSFREWGPGPEFDDVLFVPISALHGDNVVKGSTSMPWYDGPPLLDHLETVDVRRRPAPARFPVQWVIRPVDEEHHDYRGYAGQVAAGTLRVGEEVVVLPSGLTTRVAAIDGPQGPLEEAFAPMSVTVQLEDDLDVARGDLIAPAAEPARVDRELTATVCWLGDAPVRERDRYLLKHTTRTVRAVVDAVEHRLDVESLERQDAPELKLNDIGRLRLRTSAELVWDPYRASRTTGAFILIDESTNDTVGAGLLEDGA